MNQHKGGSQGGGWQGGDGNEVSPPCMNRYF